MRRDIQEMHTSEQAKFSHYRNKFFPALKYFNTQLKDVHSSPSVSSSQSPREHKRNNSALKGTIESFFLESKDHFDSPQFMVEVE